MRIVEMDADGGLLNSKCNSSRHLWVVHAGGVLDATLYRADAPPLDEAGVGVHVLQRVLGKVWVLGRAYGAGVKGSRIRKAILLALSSVQLYSESLSTFAPDTFLPLHDVQNLHITRGLKSVCCL